MMGYLAPRCELEATFTNGRLWFFRREKVLIHRKIEEKQWFDAKNFHSWDSMSSRLYSPYTQRPLRTYIDWISATCESA